MAFRNFIVVCLCILPFTLAAQKKKVTPSPAPEMVRVVSYELLENGDTINRMDSKNQRQGPWLITTEARYGEDGFHEYGNYVNNVKQGKWGKYDLHGHVLSEENFTDGKRDGEARYYENGYLFCVGNYLALKAKYAYDTLLVEDVVDERMKTVILKADLGSVRHGFWTYYQAPTMKVIRVEEYQADELIYQKEYPEAKDSVRIEARMKSWPHVTNKPMPQVWTLDKDKNKRPVRYTDFPENTQYVTPNVRKKTSGN